MRLSDILQLRERREQAMTIVDVLKYGMTPDGKRLTNIDEFAKWLASYANGIIIGSGIYAVAWAGARTAAADYSDADLSNQFIVKISKIAGDPWRRFADHCYKNQGETNPLFPKIMHYAENIGWLGNSNYSIAVIEMLRIDRDRCYLAASTLNRKPLKANFLLFMRATNHPIYKLEQQGNKNIDLLADVYMKRMGYKDLETIRDFGEKMVAICGGIEAWYEMFDVHQGNVGWRPNGELVIFDPVA